MRLVDDVADGAAGFDILAEVGVETGDEARDGSSDGEESLDAMIDDGLCAHAESLQLSGGSVAATLHGEKLRLALLHPFLRRGIA